MALEAYQGGRAFERGPDGFDIDPGRMLEVERPSRARFTWQIGSRRERVPHPAKASEAEVRFTEAEAGGTRVELEHRGFSRHGERAGAYRA